LVGAAVVGVAVLAVVALLGALGHPVAAELEATVRVAAVVGLEVAVVALLAGALVAVAAGVELALGVARLAGAVVVAEVALLRLRAERVDQAVAAHREL